VNVSLEGIGKRFGAVAALEAVDLQVRAGEVLALLGENGAGKSTLAKLLYGVHHPDAGTIAIDGHPVVLDSPRAARAAGVGMVFQQFSLIPALTVAENLMLARPEAPRWLPPRARAWRDAVGKLGELAPEIDPRTRAGDLSVGEKQLVELAKALNLAPRLLILDEPTSVLGHAEAQRLWARVRALAAAGTGVVLITHKLDDVAACADRVAVMRAGRVAGETTAVGDVDRIVGWMMGGHPPPPPRRPAATVRPRPLLAVRELVATDGAQRLACGSLEAAAGEIIGIAGVTGNGQELLGRVLAGVTTPAQGCVLLDGSDVAEDGAPTVGFISEQPFVSGCAPELSLLANLEVLQARRLRWLPRWDDARQRGVELLERFDVRPRDLDLPAGALSGGNLQKLVVGRELARDPRLVVACYPTMGLDLGAAAAVVSRLLAAAAGGAVVVWISEDLDALLAHADRVAVLYRGRLRGPIPVAEATRQGLGAWMTGAEA
jgi:simple sugar transport system ATP-binding protein